MALLTGTPWQYLPRQQTVRDLIAAAPDDSILVIGYGGAVGPGKSFSVSGIAAEYALDYPGVENLIGREDAADVEDSTMKTFDAMTRGLPYLHKGGKPAYRELKRTADAAWGRVTFRGLKDWESLMSNAYGFIGFDEAHEIPLAAFLGLASRLRPNAAGDHPRVYVMLICFNPLGGWPERMFMKGEIPEKLKNLPGVQVHFVPARMYDNPYLPPNYESFLRALYPDHLVTKLIEGLPGGVENAIYPTYDPLVHMRPIPATVQWVPGDGAIGVDFGTSRTHPSAVVAVTRDTTGRIWVREVWTEVGGNIANIVKAVRRMQVAYGITRGRVDPNQDVLAQILSGNENRAAQRYAFSRATLRRQGVNGRIGLVGPLFDPMYGPVQTLQTMRAGIQLSGPWQEDQLDTPGLLLDVNGAGMAQLSNELQMYHYESEDSEEPDRDGEDTVAALEYANEEMARPSHVIEETQTYDVAMRW